MLLLDLIGIVMPEKSAKADWADAQLGEERAEGCNKFLQAPRKMELRMERAINDGARSNHKLDILAYRLRRNSVLLNR